MLFGSYRGRFDLLPWTVAGLSAWIGYEFLPGTWYVVLGGVAGCLAGALRQLPAGNA
jgi:predicted branched-subunit amino acid permease